MTASVTVSLVALAPLLTRYDMRTKKHLAVGVRDGQFGRESEAGHPIMAEAQNIGGKLYTDSSLQCGAFYPETVVVSGEDENDASLPHWMLRIIMRRLNRTHEVEGIILPRGYVGGEATWRPAVRSVRGKEWWFAQDAGDKLQDLPNAEVITERKGFHVGVFIEDLLLFLHGEHPGVNGVDLNPFAPRAGEAVHDVVANSHVGVVDFTDKGCAFMANDPTGRHAFIWRMADGLNARFDWPSKKGGPVAPVP